MNVVGLRVHYKHDEEDTGEIVAVHELHDVVLYTVRWDGNDSPSDGLYRRDELIPTPQGTVMLHTRTEGSGSCAHCLAAWPCDTAQIRHQLAEVIRNSPQLRSLTDDHMSDCIAAADLIDVEGLDR
jgi:hypothetical protein